MRFPDFDQLVSVAGRMAQRRSRRRARMILQSRLAFTLTAILLILAVGAMLLPFAQQAGMDRRLDAQARRAASTALGFPHSSRNTMIQAAVTYNKQLLAGGQPVLGEETDPWSGSDTHGDFTGSDDREYESLLSFDSTGVMGRVLIPSISVDLPIRHGSGSQVLETGAGHLHGTSLPVGGDGTHTVITAHSNMSTASFFTRLDELQEGDPFYLEVAGKTLAYRVSDIRVVNPRGKASDYDFLRAKQGVDEATLLTCTGSGNTKRLLVTGVRNRMPDQIPYPGRAPKDRTAALKGTLAASGTTLFAGGVTLRTIRRRRPPDGRHRSAAEQEG